MRFQDLFRKSEERALHGNSAGQINPQKRRNIMKTKGFLLAAISLALTFTFSGCTDDSGSDEDNVGVSSSSEGGNGSVSSSSDGTTPSSSSADPSSSSEGGNGSISSSSSGGQQGTYESVVIGTQTWMKKNLNIETEDSWCYDDDPANCEIYGRLYTWEAAMSACPSGWHLPSAAEWQTLVEFAGGEDEDTAGMKLKAASGWNDFQICDEGWEWDEEDEAFCSVEITNVPGGGTDDYEFAALPGGYGYSDGSFNGVGDKGNWWSSAGDTYYASSPEMGYSREFVDWDTWPKSSSLLSVRCIKD
jgi:uncharacterized protein (TIGR02145 family)